MVAREGWQVCRYWTALLVCSWNADNFQFGLSILHILVAHVKMASSNFFVDIEQRRWSLSAHERWQVRLSILNILVSLCELVKRWQPCNFVGQYSTVRVRNIYIIRKRNISIYEYVFHEHVTNVLETKVFVGHPKTILNIIIKCWKSILIWSSLIWYACGLFKLALLLKCISQWKYWKPLCGFQVQSQKYSTKCDEMWLIWKNVSIYFHVFMITITWIDNSRKCWQGRKHFIGPSSYAWVIFELGSPDYIVN